LKNTTKQLSTFKKGESKRMTQLEINEINFPVDSALSTWGQLLEELETQRISKGKAIASVHFDGNEVSQFRHGEVLEQLLNSIGQIKVTAKSMDEMLKEAVFDANNFLLSLQTAMVDAAETFRNQMIDHANQKLTDIFQGLKMFVSLIKGMELSLLSQNGSGTNQVDNLVAEMGPVLEGLIESQGQQDWILVADILEFELSATMGSFEPVLEKLKQKIG
jgi:hypothetical protein